MTIGANLYFKDTDGKLNLVKDAFEDSPGNTVACREPQYVAYETGDNADQRSTKIALLLNGQVDGELFLLSGQRIGDPTATGTVLTGLSAFATYNNEYQDFRNVPQFMLHRILNRQVGGYLTDVVVSELTIDTGNGTNCTTYDYDTDLAVFDSSGLVAQYATVTAKRIDQSSNKLGSTLFEYFNGLAPDDPTDPLNDCYSLANGYLKSETQYRSDGIVVASTVYTWDKITLSMPNDGGFAMLANSVVLMQTKIEQTLHSLPVIALGGAENTNTLSDLTSIKVMEYDEASASLLQQSETRYN